MSRIPSLGKTWTWAASFPTEQGVDSREPHLRTMDGLQVAGTMARATVHRGVRLQQAVARLDGEVLVDAHLGGEALEDVRLDGEGTEARLHTEAMAVALLMVVMDHGRPTEATDPEHPTAVRLRMAALLRMLRRRAPTLHRPLVRMEPTPLLRLGTSQLLRRARRLLWQTHLAPGWTLRTARLRRRRRVGWTRSRAIRDSEFFH